MSFVASDCACVVVNTKSRRKAFDKTLLLSAAAVALIASPAAQANPVGGAVTTGSASVSTSANKTNVNQKSEDVVIDWSSFNIGSGQTTQFYQPNAQAIAVNRIGGANASQILGTLDANGRVVLINGNGVLFGKNSQVNVGSLIATTTDGSDSDVLSGKFTQAGKQNAAVTNNGTINAASGGTVALVAPNVTNTGTVNAKLGTVALGAANKFTVDFSGDGLVSFAAQGDVNTRAAAINSGLLSGANVSMTAHAANGIATGIVNMSGIITAQGVQNVGGTIYLNAGNGTLTTTGTLNAAGVTGGGQIETSGEAVNISGHVTGGKGGLWKVDPENLTIDAAAAGTIDGTLSGGTSVLEQTTSGVANGTGNQTSGAGNINVESALSWNSAATLTLDSYHSINIAAPITITGAGGITLITNDNGGAGGDYFFNNGAHVAFTDVVGSATQGSLTINGQGFTLANSIAQLKTDIANFAGSHYYALANSYDASGDNGGTPYTSVVLGSIFSGAIEGLGNTISNLSIDSSSTSSVGLFTLVAGGTVRDLGLTNVDIVATDPGNSGFSVGAFAGLNAGGTFLNDWATGTISGGSGTNDLFGGLVGDNVGTIENSHAAVAVTNSTSGAQLGGVAGFNGGTIGGTYATGAITGGSGGTAGGLVGLTSGTISQSYSTGVVIAGTSGGLVGGDTGSSGDIMSSYWDLQTSGIGNPSQGAGNVSNDSGITGETTAALQGTLPSGFSNATWSTGAGLYPYLSWQFSSTPQVLSGLVFGDHGVTPLQAGNVYVDANGSSFATLTTGANGYFYDVVAPGAFVTSEPLLAYTTGANNGAHVEAFSGSAAGFDIWGDTLIAPTSVTTYSSASGTSLQSQDASLIATAIGSDSNASFVAGLTHFGYVATGGGFTIDQSLSPANGLFVETRNGDLTVADPVTIAGANGLTLYSSNALTIDAPISITGAGAVALAAAYDTATVPGTPLLELSFGLGPNGFAGSVNYGSTNNGGTLTINGTPYTLLYSMSDVDSLACSNDPSPGLCVNPNAENLAGNYALANSLDASGFDYIAIGSGDPSNEYTGMFEGLGHTISNLTFHTLNPPDDQGLFAGSSGSIRDIGMVGGSIGCCGNDGFLVGFDAGVIENTFETGTVVSGSENDPSTFTGGLVGQVTSSGVIANSFATGQITDIVSNAGGLVGDLQGTLVNDYATISVVAAFSGEGSELGGLVGEADSGSRIESSYATGAVTGHQDIGGLVGYLDGGNVSGSFATGAVSGTSQVGGLVGESEEGAISNSYAMGSVSGSSQVGGLVGALFDPSSSVTDSYSIGRVTGSTAVGGLVGLESDTGGVTDSYWDTETSGQSSGGTGAVPLTTAQMQGTFANMPGFAGPTWATSAGLFPYLSWQYASTPQAISGIAYSNGGGTVLQGGTVSTLVDGTALGTASTGANGYYYLLVVPGTITDNNNAVLAYSSANGARVDTATDALDTNNNVSGFDVWGATLIAPTSDTTYSTASATSLQTQDAALIAQAVGGNADPTTGLTNYGYIATGFTINQPLTLSSGLYVKTTSGNIVVDDALTLPGSEGLTLDSAGALTVDAPISITGAGALTLDYSTSALTNLSFGLTSSGFAGGVNYGSTNNGGTLTINGAAYTLLYSMTDIQNINASDMALDGNYALATSINASGVTGWTPLGVTSNGLNLNTGQGFAGIFEGLGHTISNFTVDNGSSTYSGLFGLSSGTIRDVGVTAVSVSGSAGQMGGLVDNESDGTIANDYVTGTVDGTGDEVGGLVGYNDGGAIANSFSTAAVTGTEVVGGLAGFSNDGAITDSYSTGAVSGTLNVGGLVGVLDDFGAITDSFATGAVGGAGNNVGGLVGLSTGTGRTATITGSYATGAVTDTGSVSNVGGLVGDAFRVTISNSFATGAVEGGSDSQNVGGFVGGEIGSASSIANSFSTGLVSGGNTDIGGFVGDDTSGGGITNSYWDISTSGIGATQGAGNITNDSGVTGKTTSGLQGALPGGFSNTVWGTGTGLYPYLLWQFSGTPEAVAGFTVASNGKTDVSGLDVSLLVNGESVAPAIATSSGADGYYYLLLAPGTISNSGSPLFAYLTNGVPGNAYVGNALGGDGALTIEEGQLRVKSGASSLTGLFRALNTALGGNTGADFLYSSASGVTPNVNLFISDSAANFNVNSTLDVGSFWFNDPDGAISESGGGSIIAGVLRGTTENGVALNDTNEITALGAFSNTGSGGVAITDGKTLSVRGALNAGSGDLSLTTTNGGSIDIDGSLATGGTLTLTSAGSIWQAASSVIIADTLTGSSDGATRLQGANAITDLGSFTNTDGNFFLTDNRTLTVDGTANAGSRAMSLKATTGDVVVDGALDAGNLTLVSSLGEVDGTGAIAANVINVTADTGIDLDGTSNNIHHIGTRATNSGPDVINQ